MRVKTIEAARVLRDGGIEAMDALNAILQEIQPTLGAEEAREIRGAIAQGMTSILENVVNPALQAYPELEVDEELWGGIAIARARGRVGKAR